MAKPAGLQRSGKSCRFRWVNYLKPGIKHGNFTKEEEDTIIYLHGRLGNSAEGCTTIPIELKSMLQSIPVFRGKISIKWSVIASRLPGRTDNEIKNYWHTYLSKRLKYNSVPKSEPFQISNVETEQSSSEIDLPPANAPEASNSESSGAIQLSPQFSTDSLPSSSSNPAAKIDKNQTIGSSETFGKLQSILEQPFTVEGSYTAENSGAIYAEPSALSCWLNFLMEDNIYGG
ncbi:hypothetical protein CRYUN_Cryun32bG0030000 [Craigia yunnanensis]